MSLGDKHHERGERPAASETDDREARRSSLDLPAEELAELAAQTVGLVTDYFQSIADLRVFPAGTAQELSAGLTDELPEEPVAVERLMEEARRIFEGSRHNGHPRFFGYVASPSTPAGAFAQLLMATLNSNVTSWRSAPAPTELERRVVGWLARMIGYGEEAGGLLTSGGSMANLNALFIAHRAGDATPEASRRGLWRGEAPAALYVSDQVHLSIPKAADILGLGREQVRTIETDAQFRMDVRSLRDRLTSDRARGLSPFCVVANAGTVASGAVDPLAEIGEVARAESLWFHIDGAYGALAAVVPARRALFDGLARADSVSLDPHKWLYTPLDCGCLLLREPDRARRAFAGSEADYIKIYEEQEREAFAFWDYGIELSRPFRALTIWMMLRYYGVRAIRQAIGEDVALAAYLSGRLEAAEDFELLAPTTLGICCFRYVPPQLKRQLAELGDDTETGDDAETRDAAETGDAAGTSDDERAEINSALDELNARIMQTVQRGGRAYLSNASLRGRFALRVSITNFRTTRRDLDETLDIIREAAHAVGLLR